MKMRNSTNINEWVTLVEGKCPLVSINQKYLNRSFVLSAKYRQFKQSFGLMLKKFQDLNLEPPYSVHVEVWTSKDQDNIKKPIYDMLQEMNIIDNDKHILEEYTRKYSISRTSDELLLLKIKTMLTY